MSGRMYKSEWDIEDVDEFGVLDGRWVLEVKKKADSCSGDVWSYELIGGVPVEDHELDYSSGYGMEIDESWGYARILYVASEPFAALTWTSFEFWDNPGRRLVLARQIHKGELGRYPETPKLTVVYDEKRNKNHRQRHRNGWVRLTELAEVSGLTIKQIMTNYWPVIDYGAGQPRRIGPEAQIEVLLARDAEWIVNGWTEPPVQCMRDTVIRAFSVGDNHSWPNAWIRKGVAKTILHLVQFGHDFAPTSIPA